MYSIPLQRYDQNNPNDSILLWGDTLGEVHMIFFNSSTIALFERPSANTGSSKPSASTTNGKRKNILFLFFSFCWQNFNFKFKLIRQLFGNKYK